MSTLLVSISSGSQEDRTVKFLCGESSCLQEKSKLKWQKALTGELRSTIENLTKENETLRAERNELKIKIGQMTENFSSTIRMQRVCNQELIPLLGEANASIETFDRRMSELQGSQETLMKTKMDLDKTIKFMQADKAEDTAEIAYLKRQLGLVNEQLSAYKTELSQEKKTNRHLKRKNAEIEDQLAQSEERARKRQRVVEEAAFDLKTVFMALNPAL